MEWLPVILGGVGGVVLLLIGVVYFQNARLKHRVARRAEENLGLGQNARQTLETLRMEFPQLNDEQAGKIMELAARQKQVERAVALLQSGLDETQARTQLEAEGITGTTADEVLGSAGFAKFCLDHPLLSMTLGIVLPLLGVVGIVGGVLLWLGNRSGKFKTFPFSGQIAMVIGVTLLGLGSKLLVRMMVR